MIRPTFQLISALLVGLGLTACVSGEDRAANEAKVLSAREDAGLRPERKRMSVDEAKAAFVGMTRNVKAFQFGSQITYIAPNGSVYLWFPGNPVVLEGKWSFKETGGFRPYAGKPVSETSLCFDYGPRTVNAWSRQRGGVECISSDTLAFATFESESGDIFGLAGRTQVPFVLPREKVSLADLRKRAGPRS